jgi:hypothetical protein
VTTRRLALVGALAIVAAGGVLLLNQVGPDAESGTALRTVWGEPDLSGIWRLAEPVGARAGRDTFNLTELERLYRPEARAKMAQLSDKDDPALHCKPSAFPRAATVGGSIQVMQSPGLATVFTEAFPMYRIIPTDGKRRLSADFLIPYFMGSSAGRWDGDTLVVDVISFNGESWLAGYEDKPTPSSTGVWPTSQDLHVTERWRRVDGETLEYRARIEDPQMLTGPWETPPIPLKRQNVDRMEEALCIERDGASSYLERFGFRGK